MLKGIAEFSMKGRWYAAIITALFSALALILPPFIYIASGVISLTTLRMGPREGLKVVSASTVILFLVTGLLLNDFSASGLVLVSSWLPILGVAMVLGYTRSFAKALLAAAGVGVLFVVGVYVVLSDPQMWWLNMMTPFMDMLSQQEGWQLDSSQTQTLMASLSSMMTGLIAAGLTLNMVLGLIIGRSWQAKLYNPGGFAEEFYQIKLGKQVALISVLIVAISMSPIGDSLNIVRECLPVILALFAIQGLSVVHAIVNQRQKRSFWIVGVYILLIVMMPQMVALLAVIGVLEQWLNFRKHSVE
jgi:hypothetical protein